MLVLSRKNREAVIVGGGGSFARLLKITVLGITASKVKLGFEVDADIPVHRLELWERMAARGEFDSGETNPPAENVQPD
jgi:carbon storage regulator CsrA